MPRAELENLVRSGALQREPPSRSEIEGLLRSAAARLRDAARADNSDDSRFDLAYNAAHALALAALRWHGYRPLSRYVVFHALVHTLGMSSATSRVLSKCHDRRNRIEYGGDPRIDETLLADLLRAAEELVVRLRELVSSNP